MKIRFFTFLLLLSLALGRGFAGESFPNQETSEGKIIMYRLPSQEKLRKAIREIAGENFLRITALDEKIADKTMAENGVILYLEHAYKTYEKASEEKAKNIIEGLKKRQRSQVDSAHLHLSLLQISSEFLDKMTEKLPTVILTASTKLPHDWWNERSEDDSDDWKDWGNWDSSDEAEEGD